MTYSAQIAENSDSLIDLLTAQCGDLEKLLALSRAETNATERGNFEEVFDIVSQRAELGSRLESFQRQIAELREHLGTNARAAFNNDLTARIVETANLTLAQDQKTRLLLTDARETAAAELNSLGKGQRGANAYLREQTKGLSYNRDF